MDDKIKPVAAISGCNEEERKAFEQEMKRVAEQNPLPSPEQQREAFQSIFKNFLESQPGIKPIEWEEKDEQ